MPDARGAVLFSGPNEKLRRFRYKTDEPAAPRLCRALKLSNNPALFKKIQTAIENLGEEHLDINAPVSEQNDTMALIEDQITSKYPHLFVGKDNEANLFFALRTVVQKHQRTRKDFLRPQGKSWKGRYWSKVSKNVNEKQTKGVLDLTLDEQRDSEHSDSGSNFSDEENLDQGEAHQQFSVRPISNSRLPSPPRRRMPLTARTAPNTSPQTIKVGNANHKRLLPSAIKPAAKQGIGSHTLEIQQFLSACNPPMNHYLQHFIAFGCDNHEFLREISSWAPDKRLAILRRILTNPVGENSATEMEIAVVENMLETYFIDEEV